MNGQVEIRGILDKLASEMGAGSVTVYWGKHLYYTSGHGLKEQIWLDYKHLKKPKLLQNAVVLPILRKNSLRALFLIEKNNPTSDDAMLCLTWILNKINLLEQALQNQTSNSDCRDHKVLATPCAPGIAMGKIKLISISDFAANIIDTVAINIDQEILRLANAVKNVVSEMQGLSGFLQKNNIGSDLLQAYCNMLDRHGIMHDASEMIVKKNCSAESAVQIVVNDYIEQFGRMSDPYLRARAIDIKDIGFRIFNALSPETTATSVYDSRTILIAEDISPLMIAEVPSGQLAGLVCLKGSKYSHASILARALGVPFVIEANDLHLMNVKDKVAIVDGYLGSVHLDPSESSRRSVKDSLRYESLLEKTFQDVRAKSSETGDGVRVELNVNVGLGFDIQGSLRVAADGVGLFRTEVPFMLQSYLPSVESQRSIYTQVLKSFHPKQVTIRTLDIGGDKHLPYITRQELNPYLGVRGFRFAMEFPSVFRMQVEAVLLANAELGNARLLLPIITSVEEVLFAREVLDDLQSYYGFEHKLALGVMIEVPGVIALIPEISDYVDFFSVGTNDLTQYILAVDRNNSQVSSLYDSWHPAVLSALVEIYRLCDQHKKPVSVCGELAGDPMGALVLIAIGYRSLSMNHKNLLKVKWLLRQFTIEELAAFWSDINGNFASVYKVFAKIMKDRDFGRLVLR